MPSQREMWDRLGGEADLLVVGGGITGTGIARDAAMRGLRVPHCHVPSQAHTPVDPAHCVPGAAQTSPSTTVAGQAAGATERNASSMRSDLGLIPVDHSGVPSAASAAAQAVSSVWFRQPPRMSVPSASSAAEVGTMSE